MDLRAPITRFKTGSTSALCIQVPVTAAMMQSVADDRMAIALARCGGLAFICASQPIASRAEMVRKVKNHKAGFVVSDSNVRPSATLGDVIATMERGLLPAAGRGQPPYLERYPAAALASEAQRRLLALQAASR